MVELGCESCRWRGCPYICLALFGPSLTRIVQHMLSFPLPHCWNRIVWHCFVRTRVTFAGSNLASSCDSDSQPLSLVVDYLSACFRLCSIYWISSRQGGGVKQGGRCPQRKVVPPRHWDAQPAVWQFIVGIDGEDLYWCQYYKKVLCKSRLNGNISLSVYDSHFVLLVKYRREWQEPTELSTFSPANAYYLSITSNKSLAQKRTLCRYYQHTNLSSNSMPLVLSILLLVILKIVVSFCVYNWWTLEPMFTILKFVMLYPCHGYNWRLQSCQSKLQSKVC